MQDVLGRRDTLYQVTNDVMASITSFPLTNKKQLVATFETNSLQPGGTITWYLNGPPGSPFSNSLVFEGGGGHSHGRDSTNPIAVGSISPATGLLQGPHPQNLRLTFRAGDVCGQVKNTTVIGDQKYVNIYTVALGPFQALGATTGVVLVGAAELHGSNHWGTQDLCTAISRLGAAFHQQFSTAIYVNDMSLVTGGLFDLRGNFTTPHITHRDGRHVDMNWSSMSAEQRTWFKAKAEEIGFFVELHENPTHWHLRFG